MNLGIEGPRATARTMMHEGDTLFAALSWSEHAPPKTYDEAYDRLTWTAHHWQHWLDHGEFPDHPWRTFLQRSALTLKGLSYAPTGAMIAAATTSLPETPGGERNWDYRYTWIRDSTFTLWGLYTLGFDWEANDFFYFVADVAEAEEGQLQIMYGIDGESELKEEELDHLTGYEGARPVRIGNGAYNQDQHDVWGAVLDSVYLHTKSRDHLPERIWPILKKQVAGRAGATGRSPTAASGRSAASPSTSPRPSSCAGWRWTAAPAWPRSARSKSWPRSGRRPPTRSSEDICENAVDERGVFCQHYDTDALDASVLLMPLVRFLPPDDERVKATVLAIADELTQDGLVLRYRTDDTDDGLEGEEGTFTICSFWLVSALVEIGELQRGRELCERLLSYCLPAPALRGGDRPPLGPAPGQLPAGLHPPGPDQRGDARDPRRPGAGGELVRARAAAHAPRALMAEKTDAGTRRARARPAACWSGCAPPTASPAC